MVVDELEDVNEHLLGLALIRTMRGPGNGVYFEEVAVALIKTIKTEGWIPSEERDLLERKLQNLSNEHEELAEAYKVRDDEVAELKKQISVLIAQLSGMTHPSPAGSGIHVSPPAATPWITYTSTSSTAVPATQVASEYLKHRRLSS